jgi:hypothetical protein
VDKHWFKKCSETKRPIAIHWKGHALQTIPVVLSAIWVASFLVRFMPGVNLSSSIPFLVFSMLAAAQGTKYYFYHEKMK